MRRGNKAKAASALERKLEAVRTLGQLGEGRAGPEDVVAASSLTERATDRLALGGGSTVVALAGATGSGKSSLFNALVGADVSKVGVRRPTTARAAAAIWGEGADPLLDWLSIERRHRVQDPGLEGLVLLDLPDHDSTEEAHRSEVDRLVELVDVFIWVVDPQKYADAVLHDMYLRPLARHATATLVVLNQSDRLSEADRDRCLSDLKGLITGDGLERAEILGASAATGHGIEAIRTSVARRVREKRAAQVRLIADLEDVATRFETYCSGRAAGVSRKNRDRLASALADAGGAETIGEAARRSYRREAALATGWIITRWVRRFRPDPLARLHLGEGSAGRTSVPPMGELGRARTEKAQRQLADEASEGLADPWPRLIRERAAGSTEELLDDIDRTIGRPDVRPARKPSWWAVGSLLQKLFLVLVALGFIWLAVLFGLEWFQIPDPPTPELRGIPWPTLLFFGGLLLGFLSAIIFGLFARVGAARVRRRAHVSIERGLQEVAAQRVIAPVEEELEIRKQLCAAVAAVHK